MIKINLLERKSTKQRLWKTLTSIVGVSMVLNASMVGVLISPRSVSAATTAFLAPSATGGSHNEWTNANRAYSSNNEYATVTAEDDVQSYENFNFGIPAGATINGIQVQVEAKSSDATGCQLEVRMYSTSDGGHSNYAVQALTGSDVTSTLGGASNLWGASWTASDFSNGNFHLEYQYDDVSGGGCANTDQNTTTTVSVDAVAVKVHYTEAPAPVVPAPNPALPQTCGIDIGLVVDTSGSIQSGEMTQMKTALTNFAQAFSGTPTVFSLSSFNTESVLNNGFSMTPAQAATAVGALPSDGDGNTNWDSGLKRGHATFDPRPAKPNLIVIATDGSPNRYGYPTVVPGGVNWDLGIQNAIPTANTIKNSGTRIVVVGIGDDESDPATPTQKLDKMKSISGPNVAMTPAAITPSTDVIKVTDFNGIGAALAAYAETLCPGNLTVNKKADLDGNGTFEAVNTTHFKWKISTETSWRAMGTSVELDPPGTYTVVEDNFNTNGYHFVGWAIGAPDQVNCTTGLSNAPITVKVPSEGQVIITLCNAKETGTIEVTKKLDSDGNGSFESVNPAGWTWSIDGSGSYAFGTSQSALTGNHTLNESFTGPYHFVGWYPSNSTQYSCANPQGTTRPVSVSVTSSQKTAITFCNARDKGLVTFQKIVQGGSAVPANWSFAVSNVPGTFNHGDSVSLPTGSYTVTESGPAGYQATAVSGICGNLQGSSATLNVTTSGGTCTFTNARDTGTIKVNKILEEIGQSPVLNPAGWTWTLNGQTGIAGGVTKTVDTNTALQVAEDNTFPPSWYSTSWECKDGQTVIDSGSGRNFTLANGVSKGQNIICTFTNNRDRGTLIVKKHVVNNNGGQAQASDFTMHIKQSNVDVVAPFAGNENAVAANTFVLPTGNYHLSETSALLGVSYSQISIVCNGQAMSTVTVTKGGQQTCVITNDDNQATIKLTKVIQNSNGGTVANPNDFNLTIGGTATTSGVAMNVNAHTPYALNETVLPGYTFFSLTGDAGCPTQLGGTATVAPGQQLSCTITNKTIRPLLTVTKVVNNGTYGTKQVSDFPLFVGASGVTSGVTNGFNAGTYQVSETTDPNYSTVISGDCAPNGMVTLNFGDNKECTIINTYIPTGANLTVAKTDNRTTAGPGETLTYQITLTNAGQTPAVGVSANDTVPSFLTNVSNISHGGLFAAGHVTWTGLTVPAMGTLVLTFDATIDPFMPFGTTVLHNVVDVTSRVPCTGEVQNVETCQGDDDTTVESTSTILVAKSGTPTVVAGGNLVYTINWSITGSSPLTNAIITDPIPTHTAFVTQTCGTTVGTCVMSFASNTASWNLGNRNPGESGTVTMTVNVAKPLVNGTVITNVVTFDTNETTPVTAQTQASVTSSPTLEITKSNNITGFINPGQVVVYTVTVSNAASATDTARNVVLNDTLPSGFTFNDTGLATKSTVIGDLAPGQSVTLIYNVTASASVTAGLYTNTASAKGDNTTTVTATSVVEVRVPEVLGESTPLLVITKTAKPTTTKPGGIVTYTLTVKNLGDADATNVTIVDTLPAGLTFVDTGTTTRTFVLGTIEPSHSRVLNYDVRVSTSAKASVYKNTAVLTADDLDQQRVQSNITVKVPKVLGLATTGLSLRDYVIFFVGLLLTMGGAMLALRARPYGRGPA